MSDKQNRRDFDVLSTLAIPGGAPSVNSVRWSSPDTRGRRPRRKGDARMLIRGLYEVAIRVRDLEKSERFYREVLGLEVGVRDQHRRWLFLRAGGKAGMVVLQEDEGAWPGQHFAFTVEEADIDDAAALLQKRGIAIQGPVYHEWMPAKSVYFADPDGHELELCAPMRKK